MPENNRLMYADLYAYRLPVAFTAAAQRQTRQLALNTAAPFEILQICDTLNAEFRFNVKDAGRSELFFNTELPSELMSGWGRQPFELPVSRIVSGNRILEFSLINGSTAVNAGDIVVIGAMLRESPPGAEMEAAPRPIGGYYRADFPGEFFAYGIEVNFTAVNQPLRMPLTIDNNYPFDMFYLLSSHLTTRPFTINIEDTSTGKSIFNENMPSLTVTGDARQPFILPVTKPVKAGGSVIITATNGPIVAANPGWIVLAGANRFGD